MRIRSIKPEFWSSDDITALHWYERLLLIGLWSYVDDNGVGRDRLASIAGDLFSGDVERDPAATFQRITEGLTQLEAKGRIARYEVDGAKYIAINGWHHQRIDKPAKARYPRPTDSRQSRESVATVTRDSGDASGDHPATDPNETAALAEVSDTASTPANSGNTASTPNPALTGHSSESREAVATVSRESSDTLAPGTGEQGNRGTGDSSSSEAADAASDGDQPSIPISHEARLLCDLLLSLMAKNDEHPRPAKPTKKWLESAERMIRIDNRDPAVVMGVLRWAKQDDFWAPNVKSIPTLREKYDQLLAASKRSIGAPRGKQRPSLAEQVRASRSGS